MVALCTNRLRRRCALLGGLGLLVVSAPLGAQIVDLDGRANGKTHPVVLSLAPGAYSVQPIDRAQGGKYEGFLLSSSNPTSYSYGYALASAEFPEKVFWDNQIHATAAEAFAHAVPGAFTLSHAGDVRFHVHDDFPGDNVGGVSLLVARDGTAPILSFADPVKVGCGGEALQYTTSIRLATGDERCDGPGPRGWSLAVAGQGCAIVRASTQGTAGDLAPAGHRLDGFERTELTVGAGNEGAISVVSLSIDGATELQACASFELLGLTLEAPAPASGDCAPATLQLVDRDGPEGTVRNLLDVRGEPVQPLLADASLELCRCTSRLSLRSLEPGTAQIVLDHEIPVTGGELGIAYDPDRMVPVEVSPGPDFPGTAADIFIDLDAAVNCPSGGAESAVEAGLIVGWINEGTGTALAAGIHELFEVRFEAAGDQAGLCSPLRYVDCLGAAAAPVRNTVTDLEDRPVIALTSGGSVCSGLEVFLLQRGDVNGDLRFDISDAIANLRCLFIGESCTSCPDAADANDDARVDISDSVYLLHWRFLDGLPPPAPFGRCGVDRTPDELGACSHPACCEAGAAGCGAAP